MSAALALSIILLSFASNALVGPKEEVAEATLAGTSEQGYLHCGPNGAGHLVKMVHNGIEYGLMAAYAEGLAVLKAANVGQKPAAIDAETTPLRDPEHYRYDLNLADIAEVWRRGSVIASWLLDLTAAVTRRPRLEPLADDAGAPLSIGWPLLREAVFTTSSLSMPSASRMSLAAWSASSLRMACSKEVGHGERAHPDSGAKCNRAKQTGFARLCQAL